MRTIGVAALALVALCAPSARAAESEIVGLLAVAVERDVADRLLLTDDQRRRLQGLADEREMKAISKAMRLAKRPRSERVAEFADYRRESERLALAVLTDEQAEQLRAVAAEREDEALQPSEPEEEPDPSSDTTSEESNPSPNRRTQPSLGGAGRAQTNATSPDDRLTFNFRQQPWEDVLRWFADRADLSLVVDAAPPGALSYRDNRSYTPAEALDVLNGVLLTKGYTLVRKDRMLLVIDLEQDVVPPNVVTDVPLADLDQRGDYELVRVLIPLGDVDPTAAAESLQRLTGPQGAVVVLPEAELLQVTETGGRIRTMVAVVEAMRAAAAPEAVVEDGAELRSYPTGGVQPATALAVLQTLLSGSETARLAIDEQAANLIALATPEEHQAIESALARLTTDGRRVEMIRVGLVDPVVAASLVTKLFDPGGDDKKGRDPNAPVVEADRLTESLLVRGTAAQIEQIRELVDELDADPVAGVPGERGSIRTLPLSGIELQEALRRIEPLWPSLRDNPLRMAAPIQEIPSFRPGADAERDQLRSLEEESDTPFNPTTDRSSAPRFRFANQPMAEPGEPVFISPGAGSTVIASRDTEALDVLEQLLATVTDASALGGRQYAVFYLKYADAMTATALLQGIFGESGSGGGGNLLGDLAGAAIGGEGGDLVGDLLGMGSGGSDVVGFDSVSVDIVPDVRLNALYVRATSRDLQTVNRLLRVIDQPRGPDRIEASGRPRLIPVYNTSVTDVATVVREVFKDRLEGAGGGGGGQPSPEEFLRALRGGDGGAEEQEPERMTLGIDERSNSLVVRSSRPLYEEVLDLVEQLDRSGVERPVATRVVSLRNTSSDALRETLSSLLGDKARVGATSGGETPAKSPNQAATAEAGADESAGQQRRQAERRAREVREQVEGLRRMQRMMERMREGGGRGGRGQGGGRRPQR